MSLNNISLPAHLLTAFYQNVLIESSAMPVPQKSMVSYLGGNEKQILILVNQKTATFLPDKELEFLTAILVACGLDISHVAIANWHIEKEKDVSILKQLSPKEILFLDVPPDTLGFSSNPAHYAIQKMDNIRYVYAPSLSQIEKTKQAKSLLWIVLKQLFCL